MTPALRWNIKKERRERKKEEKKAFILRIYKEILSASRAALPGSSTIVCDNDINPFLLLTSGEGLLQSQLRAALPMQRYRPTCSDVHSAILEFIPTVSPPWEGGRLCGLGLSFWLSAKDSSREPRVGLSVWLSAKDSSREPTAWPVCLTVC